MTQELEQQDKWFSPAEAPECTLLMMSAPCLFFMREWSKRGLGGKVKEYFTYFDKDKNYLGQMWYRRSQFDAEAKFLADKMIKNPDWALGVIDQIEAWSNKFMVAAKKILSLPYNELSNEDMIKYFRSVTKWHWLSHGVGTSVSWHADADKELVTKYILKMVEDQIKKYSLRLEPAIVFSVLSTPDAESFAAREEREFFQMAESAFKSANIKQLFIESNLNNLSAKLEIADPHLYRNLVDHYKKWRWLPYGYRGPAYDLNHFLERLQNLAVTDNSSTQLLAELSNKIRQLRTTQDDLLNQLQFNSYQCKLLKMAQRIVFIKELRKCALYHGFYCYEPFLREVATRLDLKLEHVWSMSLWEIERFMLSGKAPQEELKARTQEAVAYYTKDSFEVWTDKKAHDFFGSIPKEKFDSIQEIDELTGTCASPGYAKGEVRIIEVPSDIAKMCQGGILVSETTYPSLVPAMKKAAAIVTNAGGLTCHAAIVSRELRIPCVVGTKIANKVLKDGDKVEVDATKGIIRRLP